MARPRNTLKRKIYFREVRNRFLIVCEGEKTEPNYFRMFPINKDIVEVSIAPTGYVTDSLVGEAIKRKEQAIQEKNHIIKFGVYLIGILIPHKILIEPFN